MQIHVNQIRINKKDIENSKGGGGLEIIIDGVKGNPQDLPSKPCPIFIEYYKGEYRVIIWNNTQDPEIIVLKKK